MERQIVLCGVPAQLAQRLRRARANGVGCDTDCNAAVPQRLELAEILRDRSLPKARAPAPEVARVQADEGDARLVRRLRGRPCLVEAQVVELSHRGEPVRPQLPVDLEVLASDLGEGQRFRERDHLVAPGPEVAAPVAAPQGALERVAMSVDEAGDRDLGHARILPVWPCAPSQLRSRNCRTP